MAATTLPTVKTFDAQAILRGGGGVLSALDRRGRVGVRQLLVDDVRGPLPDQTRTELFAHGIVEQENPVGPFETLADIPLEIMLGLTPRDVQEAVAADGPLWFLPLKVRERFDPPIRLNGEIPGRRFGPPVELDRIKEADVVGPSPGAHQHSLDREEGQTADSDGLHSHLFRMEDGTILKTDFDGGHSHALSEDGEKVAGEATHSHRVQLPDGTAVQTGPGTYHDHEALFSTTSLDGSHRHELLLPGGNLRSMTASEIAKEFDGLVMGLDPYESQPESYVLQAHCRGRDVVHVLRMPGPAGTCYGWEIGAATADRPIDSIQEAREASIRLLDRMKVGPVKARKIGLEPKAWMDVEGIAKPGSVAAAEAYPGVILAKSSGAAKKASAGSERYVYDLEGLGRLAIYRAEESWLATLEV